MATVRAHDSALLAVAARKGWKLRSLTKKAREHPPAELDTALRLALELAGEPCEGQVARWHEPLFTEARRRLYPDTFPEPTPEVAKVSEFFFPLAQAVLAEQAAQEGSGIIQQLPFVPLTEEEIARWPSGEEYRRMLRHVEDDALLVSLAMAQEWEGLTI